MIAAHPSVPANNLGEFIAYLKANPGKVNYASQGNGSLSHIGTDLLQQSGTFMTHIPYRGSGPAVADVLAGQVQVFITTPPSVMQHVVSGKLKAFAVTGTSATRAAQRAHRGRGRHARLQARGLCGARSLRPPRHPP